MILLYSITKFKPAFWLLDVAIKETIAKDMNK